MTGRNGNESQHPMSDPQQPTLSKSAQALSAVVSAAKRTVTQKDAEVYRRIESLLGLVPSWLQPEDAKALLAYAPSVPRRK